MEEEYRMQKAQVEINTLIEATKHTNGANEADDNASTRGVISPSQTPIHSETDASPSNIPTIRISTESSREKRANGENGEAQDTDETTPKAFVDKPIQAAISNDGDETLADENAGLSTEPFSFSNKRLCERWLDNLFMVLYEVCSPLWAHLSI